jgi:2-oxoglutarate/2-oxoacid ferredoxin oxidoreductase subunit beta
MNTSGFLRDEEMPFCKGCGHSLVSKNCEKALAKLDYNPLDVILVTDIGCHGIADKFFLTHTVHGLHGRSVALAGGISLGISKPGKKIIVFIGDGGAAIGMQHLIGAAHYGLNMTVVIHNNMLYGMTGGQTSEFTPYGFRTPSMPEGNQKTGYDICKLISVAGSAYTERVLGVGDYSDSLAAAVRTNGFSLIEVMEICPSYGLKSNPGLKLSSMVKDAGLELKVFDRNEKTGSHSFIKPNELNLLSDEYIVEKAFDTKLKGKVSVSIAGSAGEGVQSAAEFLAKAAMKSGLNVTKKGSYPVTVGVGYSAADIIMSSGPINYTGITLPDTLIITSSEGLSYSRATAALMKKGKILVDDQLDPPVTGAEIIRVPFRSRAGERNSSIYSIFWFLNTTGIIPVEAMKQVFLENKISRKIPVEKMMLI